MPYPNTKLVHIYGFTVEDGETVEIKAPARLFKLPFYGSSENTDEDKLHYVGIEIGTEFNPLKRLCTKQSGIFKMSMVELPESTIKKMKKLYPRKELKCHSFLSDVYTSHYYSGSIMIGYFFSPEGNYNLALEHAEDDENYVDPCELEVSDIVETLDGAELEEAIEITHVAHTLENGLGEFFIGKQLSHDFVNFEFSHDDEPGNTFYNICHEVHNLSDYSNFNLQFKEGWISSAKLIAFIPTMCYCCT